MHWTVPASVCDLVQQPRQLRILNNGQHDTTSELERRAGDLSKLDKDHPARPLILDCLQDTPDSRPSAVELHQALLDIQQKYTGTDRVRFTLMYILSFMYLKYMYVWS